MTQRCVVYSSPKVELVSSFWLLVLQHLFCALVVAEALLPGWSGKTYISRDRLI